MTTLDEKRLLVRDALELLTGAFMRLQKPQHWTGRAYALDGRGRSVRVDDPRAARFCLLGALLRAEHDEHGTAMPLQTSPDPQADDLLEPVLPPNAARRLILASDVLGYASRTELERLGITFVRRAAPGAEAAAAAAEMPALVLRQLPILLGLHQHARHRISLRALYRAAAALAIGLGDEKGLLDELLADWPIEEPGS